LEESLPIVTAQAKSLQPESMSWFQVAVASENVGKIDEAIRAYRKILELDPDYDLAMFNLGGVQWNAGQIHDAVNVWTAAIQRFPDHALAAKLRDDIPVLFATG
jgi:tetratricopeptide (TPR) repeat protein